jgi:hypothetical protein
MIKEHPDLNNWDIPVRLVRRKELDEMELFYMEMQLEG